MKGSAAPKTVGVKNATKEKTEKGKIELERLRFIG
jgi:hypothetical protein